MSIYSFANCALLGLDEAVQLIRGECSTLGLHTAGILRMMNGEGFELAPKWKKKLYESETGKALPAQYDEVKPFAVHDGDTIIWSPLADVITGIVAAPDTVGYPYANSSWKIRRALGAAGYYELDVLKYIWRRFDAETAALPFAHRIVVLYPTDLMPDSSRWHKHRMDDANFYVRLTFSGWTILEPQPIPDPGNTYWSHYHPDECAKLVNAVRTIAKGGAI